MTIEDQFEQEDEYGHIWTLGWEDSDKPHPGWGTMGGHVGQCNKCGMYIYELLSGGKYEKQTCGPTIREF